MKNENETSTHQRRMNEEERTCSAQICSREMFVVVCLPRTWTVGIFPNSGHSHGRSAIVLLIFSNDDDRDPLLACEDKFSLAMADAQVAGNSFFLHHISRPPPTEIIDVDSLPDDEVVITRVSRRTQIQSAQEPPVAGPSTPGRVVYVIGSDDEDIAPERRHSGPSIPVESHALVDSRYGTGVQRHRLFSPPPPVVHRTVPPVPPIPRRFVRFSSVTHPGEPPPS